MNIIELIGFIITMAALTFLYFKRLREIRWQQEHPEEYARQQKRQSEAVRKMMKEMGVDDPYDDEEVEPPPPPREKKKQQRVRPKHKQVVRNAPRLKEFESKIEKRHIDSKIDERGQIFEQDLISIRSRSDLTYNTTMVKPSRAKKLLSQKSLKDAIILREILGPPKGYGTSETVGHRIFSLFPPKR